jgi:parvulin-like peptidyl-prolyl isomerase
VQKVPEQLREEFRSNPQRVNPTVDGLWVQRMLAHKARADGLADDPMMAARLRHAQDALLAEAYLQRAEAKLKLPDLSKRAEELYKVQAADFRIPESVHVQHILVATNCRGRDEALQRAKEIHARVAKASEEEFLAEAVKSSDDPSKSKNKGDLGFAPVTALDKAFVAAVSKMKVKGEVSEPVESGFGFHVIRFVGRQPERVKPFSEVREDLIAAERQKIIDKMRNDELNLVRNDPKTHLYLENVEALTKAR